MNKTQKGAWVGLVLVAFLLYIPAVDLVEKSLGLLLTHVVGYSVGLPLFILMIYLIRKIATGGGVGSLGCVVRLTFLSLGESGLVSVSKLPVVVYAGSVLFIFVCCIAALIQYKIGGANHE